MIDIRYTEQSKLIVLEYDEHHRPKVKEIMAWCREVMPDSILGDGGYHLETHRYTAYVKLESLPDLMAFKLAWDECNVI